MRLLLASAVAAAALMGCRATGMCVYDYDCGDTEVCGSGKRCVAREIPEAPSCTTVADCGGGRACVNGRCRFAPPCLNIAGAYRAWPADGGAATGTLVTLEQALPGCDVATADGGALNIRGTVNADHTFSDAAPAGTGCSVEIGGDETLRARCGGVTFHLYGASAGDQRFLPTRCEAGMNPCDGHTCSAAINGGVCSGNREPCLPNALGIPQCTPTEAQP